MSENALWWEADKGRVNDEVVNTVRRIEMNQSDVFLRFQRLELLYDPNSPIVNDGTAEERRGGVQENVIASNVDANTAAIATTDVRARVMTDGADWQQQRRARKLEWYAEEQNRLHKVLAKCRASYKESCKKGNGLVKITTRLKKVVVKHVLVENVVVDQNETRNDQDPMQLHEWVTVDADVLAAEYPKFKKQIKAARGNRNGWRIDSRTFPMVDNQVTYLDSYRLPIGEPGDDDYVAGRHTKTIVGTDLLDEKWEKPFFPYDTMVYLKRAKSWYGISGAERAAGIQRALNKRNWQIEKQNDNIALPTTFVRPADANFTVKTSKIGAVAVSKGDYPHTVMPNAVSPETYKSREDLLDAGNREFGQNQMSTHGTKPAGLDSGAALREFKDQTSDRYSPQEQGFEDHVLGVTWHILDRCKDLGKDAPLTIRKSRFGTRRIKWADVDMGELKIQLYAASNLPRTPAGRMQFVIELAQAGVISQDSSRRLLQHPDLEGEVSLYTAALENVEQCLDEIAEGRVIVPEPFMNLKMITWRGQNEYLKWLGDGAPEDRIELLRQFVVTAAWMVSGGAAASNGNAAMPDAAAAQMGGAPPMPGADAGAMPPPPGLQTGAGPNAPSVSAFSPQAMMLRAG